MSLRAWNCATISAKPSLKVVSASAWQASAAPGPVRLMQLELARFRCSCNPRNEAYPAGNAVLEHTSSPAMSCSVCCAAASAAATAYALAARAPTWCPLGGCAAAAPRIGMQQAHRVDALAMLRMFMTLSAKRRVGDLSG